jgi:hypothetical protein
MPNSYKITVVNNTGGSQDYAFFNATPIVSGGTSGAIWSNVMKAANNTPNGATATFEVSTNFHAICGSFDGNPSQGGRVSINKSVPISLGAKVGGHISLGSTIALSVIDKSACDLGPPTTPGQGKIGNFFLDTACKPGSEFSLQDAKNNNLLVGIATSKDGTISTAMGTFAPYPNTKYQIMPQAIYHVGAGDRFSAGELVKVEMMTNTMAVDFNSRGTNDVTLIHGDDMLFTFRED